MNHWVEWAWRQARVLWWSMKIHHHQTMVKKLWKKKDFTKGREHMHLTFVCGRKKKEAEGWIKSDNQ